MPRKKREPSDVTEIPPYLEWKLRVETKRVKDLWSAIAQCRKLGKPTKPEWFDELKMLMLTTPLEKEGEKNCN